MAKTPREHIEEIRRNKFSIGGEINPLTEDLHQAVMHLSAELYTKDVHFLMELIQNAEDNEYPEGVEPSLEFLITSKDITATGAPATLLIFNNEKGFSPKNIDSICSVGRSTKKGNRKRGYIGEKGIGFKSVFLITSQPFIFSNGYKIRFSEEPCVECSVGYVVPEWVEKNPTPLDLKQIYGRGSSLPTTTIVLPLKPDKVKPVQQQLSSIHPEIMLFLTKIRQLSVREENEDPRYNAVTEISISSEINFVTRKNIQAESFLLHLSSDEKGDHNERECSYHMWRQRFPVRKENKVDRRVDVDEWVITLAFPNGERLRRGRSCPGIYAYLPTEMVTKFPFIIQADFLLASSRETILLDNKWNQGILSCVPTAFVSAFTMLVKVDAPISSVLPMFSFLPIESSPYADLNIVREEIKEKLMDENIIPSESGTNQKFFHKPSDVSRLNHYFWDFLSKAKRQGVSLHNISSHGRYILSSVFDKDEFNHILKFLGVDYVDGEWYPKCIQSSNLVLGVPEDLYLELLLFIAYNWWSCFTNTNIKRIPLLKYVDVDGHVSLCSVNKVSTQGVSLRHSLKCGNISWLINWNSEFRHPDDCFFLPEPTQKEIASHSKGYKIIEWLEKAVNVDSSSVYGYGILVKEALKTFDRKLSVTYAHFLYQSRAKNFLSEEEVGNLCEGMPLVDNYGQVSIQRRGVTVPASGSRWMHLIGTNPWRSEGFVELGEDYLRSSNYAGVFTSGNELLKFLKSHVAASDIPDLPPPNADLPCLSSLLTKENAFILLDWIRNNIRLGRVMPQRFLACLKEGSWLRISLSGCSGCGPPSKSFFPSSSLEHLLQNGFVDIALVDLKFYSNQISCYKEELKAAGVMFEFGEACEYIGNHLTSLAAAATLSRENVLSILSFIRLLRRNYLPPESFIDAVKNGNWLWTSQGCRSPVGSVMYSEQWRAASDISSIPFIDKKFYGEEFLSFKIELQLLGVLFDFDKNYQLVVDNLKPLAHFNSMTVEASLLILQCLRHVNSSQKIIGALVDKKWLKTTLGYKSPAECFLPDRELGSLMQVFSVFPLIDEDFYGGDISLFKDELKKLGVMVNIEEAIKAFSQVFKQQASVQSIGKENVLMLLAWYRGAKGRIPEDVKSCILDVKWLKTRLGDYRAPEECILYSSDWESISSITLLPFVNDNNYYGTGIHEYKEELKGMGVVVSFRGGAKFVPSGLRIPLDPTCIMPATACSLLKCVRNLQFEQDQSLITDFVRKLDHSWIKTNSGYRSPKECILFGADWKNLLEPEDGPFVDEKFYGPDLILYKEELKYIGVVLDVQSGCRLLFTYLGSLSNLSTIERIYRCLSHHNWEPTKDDVVKIWIPNGNDDGEWVSTEDCVLHDKHGLFWEQLHILEKHYEKKLLSFFSTSLGVRANPSLDDYCKLWKAWEDSGCMLSDAECSVIWGYFVKNWNSRTKSVLSAEFNKVPVSGEADKVLLLDKKDVFVADDLCLKDLFKESTTQPLFVWYPHSTSHSLPRAKLLEIYSSIGVQTLSKSAQSVKMSVSDWVGLKEVNPRQIFISKGLFKLILGFMASPSILMEIEKRHEALTSLLGVTVFESPEPITLSYSLQLSSGEAVTTKARQMLRWEKSCSKVYIQKLDLSGGHRNLLEFATHASKAISEGLFWENEEYMLQLADLLKLGFVLEFDEAAIDLLMRTTNLEVLPEDENFLATTFPSS